MATFYAGLMSGTSTDCIDGVLADFSRPDHPEIAAQTSIVMPSALRLEFLALNSPGAYCLFRSSIVTTTLARLYAQAHSRPLQHSGLSPRYTAAYVHTAQQTSQPTHNSLPT